MLSSVSASHGQDLNGFADCAGIATLTCIGSMRTHEEALRMAAHRAPARRVIGANRSPPKETEWTGLAGPRPLPVRRLRAVAGTFRPNPEAMTAEFMDVTTDGPPAPPFDFSAHMR